MTLRISDLHSTMFIFISGKVEVETVTEIFTFHYVYIYIDDSSYEPGKCNEFTFHYVYIYMETKSQIFSELDNLHSTMFIFIS